MADNRATNEDRAKPVMAYINELECKVRALQKENSDLWTRFGLFIVWSYTWKSKIAFGLGIVSGSAITWGVMKLWH